MKPKPRRSNRPDTPKRSPERGKGIEVNRPAKHNADALREAEKRYRMMVETANEGIWLLDADCRTTHANERLADMLGCEVKDILGRSTEDFMFPEDVPAHLERIARRRAGESGSYELRLRRKDGGECWALVSGAPLLDAQGTYSGSFAMLSDITERKQAEQTLRESEERNRLLVENSIDGVLLTAPDGRIFAANPAACLRFGRTEAEICRLGRSGVVDPTDPRLALALAERERTGRFRCELTEVRADGTKFPAEVSSVVFTDRVGELRTSTVVRDLTEHKRAEAALRESETKLHAVFDNSRDAISLSRDGLHVMVNPAYLRMFGLPNAEGLIGTPTNGRIAPDQRNRAQDYTDRRSRGEPAPSKYEIRCVRDNDTELDVEVSVSQFQLGAETYSLAMLRDITDRKQSEKALRTSEALHRTLFESATDALFLMDDYRFSECNAATLAIFGCRERGDIVGRYPWDFSPARQVDGRDSHARAVEMMDAALAGRPQRVEWLHARLDGTTFLAEVVLNRVEFGGRPGLLAAVRDITERKQAELALRESEKEFRTLAEQSPNMIFINSRGRVVFVNRKCVDVVGYTTEEFCAPGFDFMRLIAPESVDTIRAVYARHGRGEEVDAYEYGLVTKAGRRIDVIINTKLMDYAGSKAILGIVTDITERKLAEETLHTMVERFHLMLSHMPLGVLVTNGEDQVEFVNREFCDMFGIAEGPASLVGLASDEAVPKLLPAYADPEGTLARMRALLAGTEPAIGEEVAMRDGRVMLVDFLPIIVDGTKSLSVNNS